MMVSACTPTVVQMGPSVKNEAKRSNHTRIIALYSVRQVAYLLATDKSRNGAGPTVLHGCQNILVTTDKTPPPAGRGIQLLFLPQSQRRWSHRVDPVEASEHGKEDCLSRHLSLHSVHWVLIGFHVSSKQGLGVVTKWVYHLRIFRSTRGAIMTFRTTFIQW